jgi:hypothetical protein
MRDLIDAPVRHANLGRKTTLGYPQRPQKFFE